jgi:ABC-type uncharacterized transport system substrate-binding protein
MAPLETEPRRDETMAELSLRIALKRMTETRRTVAFFLSALGLVVAQFGGAKAHPHVFVTMQTEVLYSDKGEIAGFQQKWAFDELYSSLAIQGFDLNNDGVYDRDELHPLAKANIDSLKDFGYFTFARVSGTLLELQEPEDYWLDFVDGVLVLNFTLRLAKPVAKHETKTFSFSVYDPGIYVAFAFSETAPIRLSGPAPETCMPVVQAPMGFGMAMSLSQAYDEGTIDPNSNFAEKLAATVTINCGA